MRIKNSLSFVFALVLLCVGVLQANAQEFRASVAGQITDASGAVLPGVNSKNSILHYFTCI
jgi:hypothetical protein